MSKPIGRREFLAALWLLGSGGRLLQAAGGSSTNWPSFRGPEASGVARRLSSPGRLEDSLAIAGSGPGPF